jgi:L,D-transpeptidase catalytic domain
MELLTLTRRLVLTGFLVGLVTAPAEAAPGQEATTNVSWSAPTPATGSTFTLAPGSTLRIPLSARASGGGTSVHIAVSSLPPTAKLKVHDGNPASATITWTPSKSAAGSYTIRASAQTDESPPASAPSIRFNVHVTKGTVSFVLTNGNLSHWAFLERRVAVRATASSTAPVVATLTRETSDRTQELLLLLDGTMVGHRTWIRVRLPILPNNSTGWIPRGVLGNFHVVHTHLFLNRATFTLWLQRDGKTVFETRVGIGKPSWPTPAGQFYVRDMLTRFHDPFYGPLAFGTNARSDVLTDWPGGGFVGIHGTNQPSLIPGRISHGCIRLKNSAILRLGKLMGPGTPLTIS